MTIVRVRETPGGFDEYGDPVEGTTSRLTLTDAFTAPRSSEDNNDRGRQGVIVGLSLYAPYGTDLVFTDKIEVDGVSYDIEGDPGYWRNPLTTWEAGVEVALKRSAG